MLGMLFFLFFLLLLVGVPIGVTVVVMGTRQQTRLLADRVVSLEHGAKDSSRRLLASEREVARLRDLVSAAEDSSEPPPAARSAQALPQPSSGQRPPRPGRCRRTRFHTDRRHGPRPFQDLRRRPLRGSLRRSRGCSVATPSFGSVWSSSFLASRFC